MHICALLLLLSSPAWAQAKTTKPTRSPTRVPRPKTAMPVTSSPTSSPTRRRTATTPKPPTISPTKKKPTTSPTLSPTIKAPTKPTTTAPTRSTPAGEATTRTSSAAEVTMSNAKPRVINTSAPTTSAPTFPSEGPNAFGFTNFDLSKFSAMVFTPHQHPGWPAPHLHSQSETHGMSHFGVPIYPVWPPGTYPHLFDEIYEPHVHPDFPDIVMIHPTSDNHGHSHEGIRSYYFLTGPAYLPGPQTAAPTLPPTLNSTPPTLAPSNAPQYWRAPPNGLVSEKSCEQLKWAVKGAVCGTSLISGQCPPKVSYPDAATLCAGLGARLCRSDELANDITAWSGCPDDTRVWAADTCAPPTSSSSAPVNWTSRLAAAWRTISPGTGGGVDLSSIGDRDDDPYTYPMAVSQGGSFGSLTNWDVRCSPATALYYPRCCADAATDQEAAVAQPSVVLDVDALTSQATCQILKWPLIPLSSTVCSYGRATAEICSPSVVFATAKQMCEEPGARLCSPAEISNVVNLGDDCTIVSSLGSWLPYWTNENCGVGSQRVLRPLANGWAVQCAPYSNRARVRCCADTVGVSGKTCTELGWSLLPIDQTAPLPSFKPFATCFSPLNETVVRNVTLNVSSGVRPCIASGTRDQNIARCDQLGARLCLWSDLPLQFALPSTPGCSGGNGMLWTSSSICPTDQVPSFRTTENGVVCFDASTLLAMYCCADAVSGKSKLRQVVTASPTLGPSAAPTLSPTTSWPTTAFPTWSPVTRAPTAAPRPVSRPIRTPPTAAPTTVRSAQSCDTLGWIRQGTICSRTWKCDGVTFEAANTQCLINSGRLCLIDELARITSSCTGSSGTVWTQSPCPLDGFIRVRIGDGSQCVPVDSEFTAAVVCCADLLPAAPGKALTANPTPAPTVAPPPTTLPRLTDINISWTFMGRPENLVPDGPNLPRSVQLCTALEWPPLQTKGSNSSGFTNSSSDLLTAVDQWNNTCSYRVCCVGDGASDGCQGAALTQPDASAECAAVGARLCTSTELISGNFAATECIGEVGGTASAPTLKKPVGALSGSAPDEALWTSSLCTDPALAQTAGENVFPQCYPKTYRFKFRCCADA